MSYWDTSALAKLYLIESDSLFFVQKAASTPLCVIGEIAIYEMNRVAFAKEAAGLIQRGTAEAILLALSKDIAAGEIQVVKIDALVKTEFEDVMAHCYRHSPPVLIRTLDALHLAGARVA